MDTKKFSLQKIRKLHYKEQIKNLRLLGTDINNFFNNPYTFFKSRYYIEVSALLVFFFTIFKNFSKFYHYNLYYFKFKCFVSFIKQQ